MSEAKTMPAYRLILVPKPDCILHLIETQPPLIPNGVTVRRYSTRNSVVFEEHTAANGCVTWYKEHKP